MSEILTSDLVYGDDAEFGQNGVMTKGPSTAKRGEALPKGYKGPPSPDELREMGILVDENKFMARGGFEPEGGLRLPENLGQSLSSLNLRQAELRAQAQEQDENQEELLELSKAGQPLNLDEPKEDKKGAEQAQKEQTRPEAKAALKPVDKEESGASND